MNRLSTLALVVACFSLAIAMFVQNLTRPIPPRVSSSASTIFNGVDRDIRSARGKGHDGQPIDHGPTKNVMPIYLGSPENIMKLSPDGIELRNGPFILARLSDR